MVLLPASLLGGIPMDQLEAILAHELAHVRRHDYLVLLGQSVMETLFFYHPAVWWISHRMRVEREYCCDVEASADIGQAGVCAGTGKPGIRPDEAGAGGGGWQTCGPDPPAGVPRSGLGPAAGFVDDAGGAADWQ